MDAPGAIALEELLPLLADPLLRKNLVAFAARRARDDERADDFAHSALEEALRTRARRWRREEQTLLEYLCGVMNRQIWNWRTKASTRLEVGVPDFEDQRAANPIPTPEQAALAAEDDERADARASEIEARLRAQNDEVALAVLACEADGVHRPADKAKKLGRPVQDIYRARKRIAEHVKALFRAERAREGERPS